MCHSQDKQIKALISHDHQYSPIKINGTVSDSGIGQDGRRFFRQPTAEEVSRLTYGGLSDLRIQVQDEAHNLFAHLLNRGSSQE